MDGFKPQKRPPVPQERVSSPIPPTPRPQLLATEIPTLPSDRQLGHSPSPLGLEKPKKNRKNVILIVISTLLLLLVAAGIGGFLWYKAALTPVSSDKTRMRIDIAVGSSPADVGQTLFEKKLIRSTLAFDIYTRLSGSGSSFQAGTYNLSPSESTEIIVNHLVSGKTDEFSLTFLPGATLKENRKQLLSVGYSEIEIDAALSKTYNHPLFIDKPTSADLEGYIYGETYNFSGSATVEQILTRTFDEYYAKIQKNDLINKFKAQGLNLYEGITLASIIQREEPNPTDQKQVAQVFYLRLKEGMTLGSDVTAYYGADQIGVERSVAVDTPYNTRLHTGLPPGPIATPGFTGLQAATNPASGDYLFFLSGDDDVTYYARTDAEHQVNIRNHCRVKCAVR